MTQSTTLNPVSFKFFESKATIGEKHSIVSSASSNSNKTSATQVRRLTDEEVAKKRSLGLRYRCDEKYSFTHKCKNRQL